MARRNKPADNPAEAAFSQAQVELARQPLTAPLLRHARCHFDSAWPFDDGWCVVEPDGNVRANGRRRADPGEWMHVLAHALLHLGLGHVRAHAYPQAWNAAADAEVERFLSSVGVGRRPATIDGDPFAAGGQTVEAMARRAAEETVPDDWLRLGTNGSRPDIMLARAAASSPMSSRRPAPYARPPVDWQALLSAGMRDAVTASLRVAGGRQLSLSDPVAKIGPIEEAWSWFLANYPLLGSICAAFRLCAEIEACRRLDIGVAAIDCEAGTVFANPAAGLAPAEWRFVIGHEVLHAALRHDRRRNGRDALLWNYACDFAINLWLLDMRIGSVPAHHGLLLDESLRGLSAETIYDRIVIDRRRYRRIATLRGAGAPDVLEPGHGSGDTPWGTASLDDIVRGALRRGLDLHRRQGRGDLPGGLVEEIDAVLHPPPAWDVEFARWADSVIADAAPRRSFARASRRQGAVPDIPRPGRMPLELEPARTFAVLLDTSASMDRKTLARALGATAQMALAKNVPALRLVFCDAQPHDAGWIGPEELMGRVAVRGRGGTVLQAGIDFVSALRLPLELPLLIVTDGLCDPLRITRPHAFMIPAGLGLPFKPDGPVFRVL